MNKGKALQPGAAIGVLAFGSPTKSDDFKRGVTELEQRGYQVISPLNPCNEDKDFKHGFASGSVSDRIQAFYQLLEDEQVSAVIAVRGGYGTLGLLPQLDFQKIAAHPKPIIGYSDITVLLLAIAEYAGVATVHGATISNEFAHSSSSVDAKTSVDSLLSLLSDPHFTPKYSCEILRDGVGEGRVLAGNLTMLLTLLGTPWDVNYDGSILVVEDVNEAPYRIHRALTQLRLAGKLKALSGIVFGRFSGGELSSSKEKSGPTVGEMLKKSVNDIFEGTNYPILAGLEFGHCGTNISLPLGCAAKIAGGVLQVTESPVC